MSLVYHGLLAVLLMRSYCLSLDAVIMDLYQALMDLYQVHEPRPSRIISRVSNPFIIGN